jgi:PIN domain nuclease of toxin-antitoxin system
MRVRPLSIEHEHALKVTGLHEHHRDPVERLLIAQAQIEHLTIMTADKTFEAYDVAVVSA